MMKSTAAFIICICVLICVLCSCSSNSNYENDTDVSEIGTLADVSLTESGGKTETESNCGTNDTVDASDEARTEESTTEISEESVTEVTVETDSKIEDIRSLDRNKEYIANGEKLFAFKLKDQEYYIIQGGYFDGEHYYVAAIKKYSDGYEDARILVMDASGRKLRESEVLPLDHANSITYNDKIDKLVVAHCQSPDGHYYRYSFVDPKTLEITETGDKSYPFFAIAYSSEKEMYASGEWGGETLDLWNADFEHIKSVGVSQPGSLSQGVDCDGEGIYFVRSSQNGHPSEIRIYNWNCKLKLKIELSLPGHVEPESINVIDGEVYVIGTDWSRGCGVAYKITFEIAE